MANKYLNQTGLSYFYNKLKTVFLTSVDYDSTNKKITKTLNGTKTDVVTVATLKTAMALNNTANGAEVNQNAFSNVKVGSTTVAADSKTDTLELAAGTNVTLTPDATNDKVTIASSQPAYTSISWQKTTSGGEIEGGDADAITSPTSEIFIVCGDNITCNTQARASTTKGVYGTVVTLAATDTVTTVAYDSTNNKLTKTIDGTTTDVVDFDNVNAGSATKLLVANEIDGLQFDGSSGVTRYFTCSTAAATAAKTVTSDASNGTISLSNGSRITVRFSYAVTSSNSTLKIDNGVAYPIMYRGSALPNNIIKYGDVCDFVFRWGSGENGYWDFVGGANTTYDAMSQSEATTGTATTGRLITAKVLSTTIANAIAGVSQISYSIVTELPTTGTTGTIYLIKDNTSGTYKEYIWLGSSYEVLGDTAIEIDAITTAEIDTLFA